MYSHYMIDFRGLRALEAVAEHGTVTAAAAALSFTPSAISQQIAQLASELDAKLLQRHGRRVKLTPAAHLLLNRAHAMNSLWEEAKAEVSDSAETVHGTLRFCGVSSAIAALIAPATTHLRTTHPSMDTQIREEESADCYRLLMAKDADIAIVLPTAESPPFTDPRFEQQPLLDDPQDLLVPEGHPLAARDGVEISDAASEAWIAKRRDNDTYTLLIVACASAGFTPHITHQAKEWYAVSALVSEGLGVSLLPRMVPIPADHRVVRVPLIGTPAPSRRIITCLRRGSSHHPNIKAGIDALHLVINGRGPSRD